MSTPGVPATLQQGGAALSTPVTPVGLSPLAQFGARLPFANTIRANPKLPAMLAAAVALALLAVLYMWTRQPDYRVLYSNLSDRDGGAIITALQQMNVPYKFAEGGGAVLVPAQAVHEARLHLAQQGLPKSGSVGFELMDNQKFGISQFAEQVNYQRALEGELERTIGAIASIQSARVHLAIPKPTLFVREKQSPSAAVLVNLYPGRTLDEGQVNAITHVVASGVPDLAAKNITVVDQNGNLLSSPHGAAGTLDASQLKYMQQVEQNTASRINAILAPLFGANNVHSQVSADIDFSQNEQTAESFRPNQTPTQAAVLSQQTSESADTSGAAGAGGVPGALSNTPTPPASAPIARTAGSASSATASTAAATVLPGSTRKDVTTNYQVDKTIRHTEQPMGGIKRLSVAVVINYRHTVNAKGVVSEQPLKPEQLTQVQALVKEAMGYSEARGDSLNVVNSAFQQSEAPPPALPAWKQPDNIDLAKSAGKYALLGLAALYLFFGVLRPSMKKLLAPPAPPVAAALALEPAAGESRAGDGEPEPETYVRPTSSLDRNLEYIRQIARQDPKVIANVVKTWVSDER